MKLYVIRHEDAEEGFLHAGYWDSSQKPESRFLKSLKSAARFLSGKAAYEEAEELMLPFGVLIGELIVEDADKGGGIVRTVGRVPEYRDLPEAPEKADLGGSSAEFEEGAPVLPIDPEFWKAGEDLHRLLASLLGVTQHRRPSAVTLGIAKGVPTEHQAEEGEERQLPTARYLLRVLGEPYVLSLVPQITVVEEETDRRPEHDPPGDRSD